MWRAFMDEVIKTVPNDTSPKPQSDDSYDLKPVLRGKMARRYIKRCTNKYR